MAIGIQTSILDLGDCWLTGISHLINFEFMETSVLSVAQPHNSQLTSFSVRNSFAANEIHRVWVSPIPTWT